MSSLAEMKAEIQVIADAIVLSHDDSRPDRRFAATVLELALLLVDEIHEGSWNEEVLNTVGMMVLAVQHYVSKQNEAETRAELSENLNPICEPFFVQRDGDRETADDRPDVGVRTSVGYGTCGCDAP